MSVVEDEPEESGNKAWDLSRKLKARMAILHGKGGKNKTATRKRNFKKEQNLGDSDTTPSEFDPNDSDYDDRSSSDQSSNSSD